MRKMIEYIKYKNHEFAGANIFKYLSDENISPDQRLVFAPYMAHFVFSFMDINRFVLRDLKSDEELQHLVNIHTYEDAHHWPWYLNDLKRLGLDKLMLLSDALYYIWGDHCIKSRMLTYKMAALIGQATNKEKIMIVEVIEMTGNVFLKHTANVCKKMNGGDIQEYFGIHHFQCETGHHMGRADIEIQLNKINVSEVEAKKGIILIDKVYSLYHEFVDEMCEYAKAHKIDDLKLCDWYETIIETETPKNKFYSPDKLVEA